MASVGRTYRIEAERWRELALESLPMDAIGLDALAGCYCADNLSDGYISEAFVDAIARAHGVTKRRLAELKTALLAAQIWAVAEHGYTLVRYLQANISRSDLDSLREREKNKKRAVRSKENPTLRPDVPEGQHGGTEPGTGGGDKAGDNSGDRAGDRGGGPLVPGPWSLVPKDLDQRGDLDQVAHEPLAATGARSSSKLSWSQVVELWNQATGALHGGGHKTREAASRIAATHSPADIRAAAEAAKREGWARDNGAGVEHFEDRFPRYLAAARKTGLSAPSSAPKTRLQTLNEALNEANCAGDLDEVDRLTAEINRIADEARAKARKQPRPAEPPERRP